MIKYKEEKKTTNTDHFKTWNKKLNAFALKKNRIFSYFMF